MPLTPSLRPTSSSSSHEPWLIALVIALVFGGCANAEPPRDWTSVDQLITEEFPSVPALTTAELEALLSDPTHEVILLDAREADEHAVSHLRGAHIATSDDDAVTVLEQLDAAARPEVVIVAYCSVGYRSAALVQSLHARGFGNAVNLEGSIFAWANEERPVYQGSGRATHVHPYNAEWGALLNQELWSFDPR